ncbi:MAG: YafY family transcriptional regulator [Cyanobacteria bacterium REEB67]|jgi:predicted DNA-binding transcriptional regulator YafY|nr:YafY family transcriptional regulator [Cyanobacteria bacterium REEB67]
MRRADRLFRIVEYLKTRKRAVRASELAEKLDVSLRTIYRDVADLQSSGIPIIGEAGVGYILDKKHILRPMTFTLEELEALILGARMVRSWCDEALGESSASAIDKIGSVLPPSMAQEIADSFLFSFSTREKKPIGNLLTACRKTIRNKHKIRFSYMREDSTSSSRTVRPLCLVLFAPSWLLLAWCEKRNDFRNFRLDRMTNFEVMDEQFKDEKGKRLHDYHELKDRPEP